MRYSQIKKDGHRGHRAHRGKILGALGVLGGKKMTRREAVEMAKYVIEDLTLPE